MEKIFICLFCIAFTGCKPPLNSDRIVNVHTAERDTIAAGDSYGQGYILPAHVYLKTFKVLDTAMAMQIETTIPQVEGHEWTAVNKLLIEIVNAEKEEFVKETKQFIAEDPESKYSAMGNYFDVQPEELFCDSGFVSFCLQFSYQHAGAIHPYAHLYTFNYDLKKQRLITFADYFALRHTVTDTVSLIAMIQEGSGLENPQQHLDGLGSVYGFDFNVTAENITFNFDDYEIASYAVGMVRSPIKKERLNTFMKEEYRVP